ncbi:MAG: bifunctional UDP-N-acetylmuramoyl-tripeptide:D-alanyl-D-alanine ligase/alanine racemase [Dysgonamonadaceae bacterium]|jgi:alanine racemase|nr:bifunctional UDP-N-acetylmuramoyl-tripeptide:D-alanyl-D-alanine ligase/alanine racemase [Dysgonamonadaceae bacterium]
MNYSISRIAQIINAKSEITSDTQVRILLTDSRSLADPSVSLFFALQTEQNDGHLYIRKLYQKGVKSFVVRQDFDKQNNNIPDANLLKVDDTLLALQALAAHHRQKFNIPVIGITGSNGKTIVKEWLYQLLEEQTNTVRSPRSYNSQTGVPLSVWQINDSHKLAIFEAGISKPNEMKRLETVIKPTIGIFTTIGEAHQENFVSQEEKCIEKLELFTNAEKIICNCDNPLVKYCMDKTKLVNKLYVWSKYNPDADMFVEAIDKETSKTAIKIRSKQQITIEIPFTDDASIENAIHCLALIYYLSGTQEPPEITFRPELFSRLDPVAMRLDVNKGLNNNILINDTYNSDVNSLSIALDFMSRRSEGGKLKRVLILSDILQSGMEPAAFYLKVADLVRQKQVEHIIGIGPNLTSHSDLFPIKKEFFPTTESFLDSNCRRKLKNSIILIKGSRQSRFERITEQLEEKTHRTVLEVDLDAVRDNLKHFRSLLKKETKIICMVKAFGYGVGSYELAKTLQEHGADYLAVALADEGSELRREGITMPIIVMNPEKHAANTLFEQQLEPEIYNFTMLDTIIRETRRRGIVNYPVHIKLDTGMNRLGFDYRDVASLALRLNKENITVKSVFSHLAGSDSPQLDSFTGEQIRRFTEASETIQESLQYPILKHLLNSAGIERFAESQLDMVRLGIGLYGVSTIGDNTLRPVASLKTRILQIREVRPEETVGYNRNGRLTRVSRIACISIGYADGLDRRLGNGNGAVVINGRMCPFVGNICMDVSMVDVTDCNCLEGDAAVIFGDRITVNSLAEKLQTIPYEILTSISPRVKRVYYKE